MSNWKPFWTDSVTIESGGRHPLLLNRFHNHLEDLLIKGIVSTTDRLRYISYCCWAIGDIENSLDIHNYSDFVEAFRRRENALAIGSYLLNPEAREHGTYKIYGSITLANIITTELEIYDCSFQLMQSVQMGAYQLYYGGTMYNWGLTWNDENGVIRLTKSGNELYEIVNSYYINTSYYKKFKGERRVQGEILKEWAKINCYDNITEEACEKEREFYKNIIFRLDNTKAIDYRRDTFAFFLECINQCYIHNTCFDEDILRNIHYYGIYYGLDGKIISFEAPQYFNDVSFYWMIYEMHVYFRWWVSEYFRYFLTVLRSKDNGLNIEEFINLIDYNGFNEVIEEYCCQNKDFFHSDVNTILNCFEGPTQIGEKLSEEAITSNDRRINESADLAKFMLILAGLFKKYISLKNDLRFLEVRSQLIEDYWFDSVFLELENKGNLKVDEFLRHFLKKYIIEKHDLAMYEKRDLRRCWFTIENSKYIFQADESPIWRPAKYKTIMSFLLDMKLIEYSNNIIKLTTDGISLYKYLKEGVYK